MSCYRELALHSERSLCRNDLVILVARAKDWEMHPEEREAYNEILTDDEKQALVDPLHPFWDLPGNGIFRPKGE